MQIQELLFETKQKRQLNEVAPAIAALIVAGKWIAGALALDYVTGKAIDWIMNTWYSPNFRPTVDNIPPGTKFTDSEGTQWTRTQNGNWETTSNGRSRIRTNAALADEFVEALNRRNAVDVSNVSEADMREAETRNQAMNDPDAEDLKALHDQEVENQDESIKEAAKRKAARVLRMLGRIVNVIGIVSPIIYWRWTQEIKASYEEQLRREMITRREYNEKIQALRGTLEVVLVSSFAQITVGSLIPFILNLTRAADNRIRMPFAAKLIALLATGVTLSAALSRDLRESLTELCVDLYLVDAADIGFEIVVAWLGESYDRILVDVGLADHEVEQMVDGERDQFRSSQQRGSERSRIVQPDNLRNWLE